MGEKMTASRLWVSVICVSLLFAVPALAQQAAEVGGTIMDPTGAVIVGATVTATDVASGIAVSQPSNSAGRYRILGLQPSIYQVSCEQTGFKTAIVNVSLEVGKVTNVDITLEVGDVVEQVQVEAGAIALETQSQALSDHMEEAYIRDIPLLFRRPQQLILLTPGISYQSTDDRSFFTAFFSVAGSQTASQQYYIDGGNASNSRVEIQTLDINPSLEAVQEFRVVENNYKAEFGGSGGGLMLITSKAGTNEFHGSAWEFHRQKAFDSLNYFATEKQDFREHVFGAAIGGPIVKDKLHFYFTYEGTQNVVSNPGFQTFAAPDLRTGDFSNRLNPDGSVRAIFDPATQVLDGAGKLVGTRQQFPNNVIPSDRISPVAKATLALLPQGNRTPVDASGTNNYFGSRRQFLKRKAITTKMDYTHSEKNRFFYRQLLDWPDFDNDGPWPGFEGDSIIDARTDLTSRNAVDPDDSVNYTAVRNYLFGWTHARATLVNELRFTYNYRLWGWQNSSTGLNWPDRIGLPTPSVPATTEFLDIPNNHFPDFRTGRYALPGTGWTGGGGFQIPFRNFHFSNITSKMAGNHFFKFGYETRRSTSTYFMARDVSGTYDFATNNTASTPGDAASGDELASFMVDAPFSGQYLYVDTRAFLTWWNSIFFQDDWKISPKVNLSLGLRWEADTGMTEGRGDLMAGFSHTDNNPACNCPGAITFPDRLNETDWNNFMPRLGLVWNFAPRTVLRLGAGMFYNAPYSASIWWIPGTARPDVARSGSFAPIGNGLHSPYTLAAGMPSQPPFTPESLNPGVGAVGPGENPVLSPEFIQHTGREQAYHIMYNASIQREFQNNLLFEIGWIANLANHIGRSSDQWNQIHPNLIPEIATTSFSQGLRPFPQFNNVVRFASTVFNSNYHALFVKTERRFTQGLGFQWNYTWSKFIDDVQVQNWYDRQTDRGRSTLDRTHRMVLSGVWEVPAGKGRRALNSGPAAQIIGGWNVGGVITLQSGAPLTPMSGGPGCACFNTAGIRANVIGGNPEGPKNIDNWFNVGAFEAVPQYQFGDAGRGLFEGPGIATTNLSLTKDIHFTETVVLKLRSDFFNMFNRANFNNPGTTIPVRDAQGNLTGSTNFISGTRGENDGQRRIQLSVKIVF